MLRRRMGLLVGVLLLTPLIVLLLVSSPDLSNEQILVERVAELGERLHHSEMLNRERKTDIMLLSKQLNLVAHFADFANYSIHLPREVIQMLHNRTFPSELSLPNVYSYMPHLLNSPDSTSPAFKISRGRAGVDVVLGVPTVKREIQSYLLTTLRNLIDSMTDSEMRTCLIIVFVAETDQDYVQLVASQLERKFSEHLSSGLIEIISPPATFYPDLNKLRQTLGDTPERVRWRTKQNLDYAFLMMYSQPKGTFYVQLEDDIQTKKGYIKSMINFAIKKSAEKKQWIVLDFCQLGFIGKLFKTVEIPAFVSFLLLFHNDQPCDWLLYQFASGRVCRLDKPPKTCKKAKENVWIHYKPSIFQHIGTHSSLRGKVQKLKDKQYGKVQLHFPHQNPIATVETDIKAYKTYSLVKAYKGESCFWGLLPQEGDTLKFNFNPPITIKHFLFRTGNVEHPSDKFHNATIEILPVEIPQRSNFKMTKDSFYIVGKFDDAGLAEGNVDPLFGSIKTLRISIHEESENWAILCEIYIQTSSS